MRVKVQRGVGHVGLFGDPLPEISHVILHLLLNMVPRSQAHGEPSLRFPSSVMKNAPSDAQLALCQFAGIRIIFREGFCKEVDAFAFLACTSYVA